MILSPDAEIIEIGDEEDGTDGSQGFKQPFTTFQPYTGKFGETFAEVKVKTPGSLEGVKAPESLLKSGGSREP